MPCVIRFARATATLAFCSLAAAQSPPCSGPDQPAASQPAAPVRRLSVDEAVRLALEQNLGIQIERLNPQIQDLTIRRPRGSGRRT